MRTYKRIRIPGGTYFFTLVLADRRGNDLLVHHISALRTAFRQTLRDHPTAIEAIVVLPDHLHCIWRLPAGDDDFPTRWRLIKSRFSHLVPAGEPISASRARRSERGLWQRRYWEHAIRDERDFKQHMDYVHYNPVKHGNVRNADVVKKSVKYFRRAVKDARIRLSRSQWSPGDESYPSSCCPKY